MAILSITIIDLTLSGDNAAVIGLAIRKLPLQQRKLAAMLGASGAIFFRVTLTAIATLLLRVPYLNVLGGAVLLWITWKLLFDKEEESGPVEAKASFWAAITTIVVADLSMSFDNVMGVAGAAEGSVALIIFGLVVSIPILVAGSSLLASLMNRHPIVIYIGGAVLAHTAINMFFHDHGLLLTERLGATTALVSAWAPALAVMLWGWYRVRAERLPLEVAEVAADVEAFDSAIEEEDGTSAK